MSRKIAYVVSFACGIGALILANPVCAQEGGAAKDEQASPRKHEVYLSIFLLGSFPENQGLAVGNDDMVGTDLGNGIGGGFKAGLFPGFTNRMVGIEGETFVFSSRIRAEESTRGGTTRAASADLIGVSTMANLVLRYPGTRLQPYIGIGGGISSGYLFNAEIQLGTETVTGFDFTTALSYQFLGGVRMNLVGRWILFGEFKYFVSEYSWDKDGSSGSEITTSLDFHSQLITGGIGMAF